LSEEELDGLEDVCALYSGLGLALSSSLPGPIANLKSLKLSSVRVRLGGESLRGALGAGCFLVGHSFLGLGSSSSEDDDDDSEPASEPHQMLSSISASSSGSAAAGSSSVTGGLSCVASSMLGVVSTHLAAPIFRSINGRLFDFSGEALNLSSRELSSDFSGARRICFCRFSRGTLKAGCFSKVVSFMASACLCTFFLGDVRSGPFQACDETGGANSSPESHSTGLCFLRRAISSRSLF